MTTIVGIAVILFGLIAWLGQSLVFFTPDLATRLGLVEPKEYVEETLYIIESRALGLNDLLLTWTLPLSGVLMFLDNPLWPYLGLIGGGIYLYFSGLVVFSRLFLKRANKKIGSSSAVVAAYVFSLIWALTSMAMIVMSYSKLSLR